jgi:hemolysin activation/secretion protein
MGKMERCVKVSVFIAIISFSLAVSGISIAQIPPGKDAGSLEREIEEIKDKEAVKKRLRKEKEEPSIEEGGAITPEESRERVEVAGTKVLIERIAVTGVTIFSPEEIESIVSQYEGQELSLEDFRNIADLITTEYRKNGFVTSFAYLPPQRITQNTLEIVVAEGIVGDISLTGNEHFKDGLILGHIALEEGEYFNYDTLRGNISYINEHPDRSARVVLARGKERGETDINIELEDRLPLHAVLGYNNYNSRYVNRNKSFLELKSNNFLGLDHIVSGEIQLGHTGQFRLYSARYTMPLAQKHKLGAYYIHVDQELGKEVKDYNINGEGDIIALFYAYKLFDEENFVMSINPGFEWKDMENEVRNALVSQDRLRILKLGFDFDIYDPFGGRSIITQEFDYGIPDFLGSLHESNDPGSSRSVAGGEFFRIVTNAARVQALPASMAFMLRGAMQLTGDDLVASEQFTIGGMYTVRGYPVAEHAGDRGYTLTTELYAPPYFLPEDLKVPYTDTTFFDALRFLAFVDWGYVENQNPLPGERKRKHLVGFGPALRFEIPEKLSVSLDYGFAIGHQASDGSHSKAYVEVKSYF